MVQMPKPIPPTARMPRQIMMMREDLELAGFWGAAGAGASGAGVAGAGASMAGAGAGLVLVGILFSGCIKIILLMLRL